MDASAAEGRGGARVPLGVGKRGGSAENAGLNTRARRGARVGRGVRQRPEKMARARRDDARVVRRAHARGGGERAAIPRAPPDGGVAVLPREHARTVVNPRALRTPPVRKSSSGSSARQFDLCTARQQCGTDSAGSAT